MITSTATLTPLQAPLTWSHTPAEVLALTKDAIAVTRAVHDRIAALPAASRSFASVILPLAAAATELETRTERLIFYQNVAPDKALRDASNEAKGLLDEFNVDASMRVDVFEAVRDAAEEVEQSKVQVNAEEKRLVEKMLLDGKRAGLALPEPERKELMELKKELSQTCLEFSKNFNEENGTIEFTLEELEGIPADELSGYKKIPATTDTLERYLVMTDTIDMEPIFRFASKPVTRRRARLAFDSRLAHNAPLLRHALALRRRCARILGYPTWADYVVEVNLAKTAGRVFGLLNDVAAKLKPIGMQERAKLLALKEEEHRKRGLPFDGKFYVSDQGYYGRIYNERTLQIDGQLVKAHFPVARVVPAVLQIYQDLLGVDFKECEGEVWHPDVQLFSVWEKGATDASGFLGYTYLDIYSRENKYGHNSVWPLVRGYAVVPPSEGTTDTDTTNTATTTAPTRRMYPVAAMVANLSKATPDRPAALMRHHDVVTFFHEMGHVFHELLSRVRFARFHGTIGPLDFAEAPSQMLENWCWDPTVLRKLSFHHETGEPLPDELIEKLIQSRRATVGSFYLYQCFLAIYDMKVHTDHGEADYTALWNNLRESITLVKAEDAEHPPGQGAFHHLMNGYEASYYVYLYSMVFSADMWATVFEGNPLDPRLGKLYRDTILLPGSSRDELETLKAFLGREPTSDAFMTQLFGTVPSAIERA